MVNRPKLSKPRRGERHVARSTITLAEAKNRLTEILDRVERGEEFTITRHDEAIARLVPAKRPSHKNAPKAVESMRALRGGNPSRVTTEELLAWKSEGRR